MSILIVIHAHMQNSCLQVQFQCYVQLESSIFSSELGVVLIVNTMEIGGIMKVNISM